MPSCIYCNIVPLDDSSFPSVTNKACESRPPLPLINLLEYVLEPAVIPLQDGVLGAHVERPALVESVLQTALGESSD